MPSHACSLSIRAQGAVAVSAVAVALLAACASSQGSVDAGATGTTVPNPTPSADDGADHGSPGSDRLLDAGTVADGSPATLSDVGPAIVAFTRDSDAGVVAYLDCTACTGPVVLADPDRATPWGKGTAPLTGSYLVDMATETDPQQTLVIDADGAWSIELRSWADLPVTHGRQEGTGATVLRVGAATGSFQVGFTPAGPGDELIARAVSAEGLDESGQPKSLVFGVSMAHTQSYDLELPGIIALSTSGSWTFVPGS